jgi:hypothetical protein
MGRFLFAQVLFTYVPPESQSDQFWDCFWTLAHEGEKLQPSLPFFGYKETLTQEQNE